MGVGITCWQRDVCEDCPGCSCGRELGPKLLQEEGKTMSQTVATSSQAAN